jgi:hypothetical protein
MIPHRQLSKDDGSRCVDLSEVSDCSDGMTTLVAPQNLNAINHMRPTVGGAFPLPSLVGLPLLPTTYRQECEEPRQNAIQLVCGGRDHQNYKQEAATVMQAAFPKENEHAAVLATVQGEAAWRRPFGRPGRPLRAAAATALVGTEEWCRLRSNRGMANDHSSHVHTGSARPMMAVAGIIPK